MKKFLTNIILIALFILFPTTLVKAATIVKFNETKPAEITPTIHFEDGFVGGLDIDIKLTKDIKIKSISFNEKFASYTKQYKVNGNTLNIKIATGGIGAVHNLLNNKKELSLGKIVFMTDSNNEVNYSLDVDKLIIIDNNWNSKNLVKKDDYSVDNNNFKLEPTTNKEDDDTQDKQDTPSKDDNDDKNNNTESKPTTDGNTTNNNESSNTTNNDDNNTENSNNTINDNQNTEEKDNNNTSTPNNNNNSSNNNGDDDNSNDTLDNGTKIPNNNHTVKEVPKESNVLDYLMITGVVIVVCVAGAFVIINYKKGK